ncbi:MAG TPA: hypothetical protein VGJ86_01695 [Acidimicrobiales bacterium]|jgi:hypothetical protein
MGAHWHSAPGLSPVLDIGGEVGALIVYLAAPPATGELHACPSSAPVVASWFHTGVHHRHLDDGTTTWVAIYPEVVDGSYHLLDDDGVPMAQVTVPGGQVVELDLR